METHLMGVMGNAELAIFPIFLGEKTFEVSGS